MNTRNLIMLSGNLTDDPKYATHKDGSKTVFLKLAVQDNFKSKVEQADGTAKADYASQLVNVQGFVSATPKNPEYPNGVYDLLEKGMPISVNGHMVSYVIKDGAVDKYGTPCNRWEQCICIDNIQLAR